VGGVAIKTKQDELHQQIIETVGVDEVLKLDNQLCFQLYAASRLVVQAYAPLLKEYGLTYPQYLVLLVLWERGNATVKELGQALYLDSGTLTPLLKKLERDGLVTRERAADDDRTVVNRPTRKAQGLKKKIAAVPVELFCRVGYTPDEFQFYRSVIKNLIQFATTTSEKDKQDARIETSRIARNFTGELH
jgi:DNA-binding MarR family transcriptional regulator